MTSFVAPRALLHLRLSAVALDVAPLATVEAKFLLTRTLKVQMRVRATHIADSSVLCSIWACRFEVTKLVAAVTLNRDVRVGGKVTRNLLLYYFLLGCRL
jgi:hypothetical protein